MDIYQILGGKGGAVAQGENYPTHCTVPLPNTRITKISKIFVSSFYPDSTIILPETFVRHAIAALPHEKGPRCE